MFLTNWLSALTSPSRKHSKAPLAQRKGRSIPTTVSVQRRRQSQTVLSSESLETRVLLATLEWTGLGGDGLWNTAANWSGGAVPANNDDVIFNGSGFNTINNVASLQLNSLTYTGGGNYNLAGNQIELNGGLNVVNQMAIRVSGGSEVALNNNILFNRDTLRVVLDDAAGGRNALTFNANVTLQTPADATFTYTFITGIGQGSAAAQRNLIRFGDSSRLNGPGAFRATVNTNSTLTLGTTGLANAVHSLIVTAAGAASGVTAPITVLRHDPSAAAPSAFAPSIRAIGTITFGAAVQLGTDVYIRSIGTGLGAGTGNITFNRTVDGQTAGGESLIVDTDATSRFVGNVGGTVAQGLTSPTRLRFLAIQPRLQANATNNVGTVRLGGTLAPIAVIAAGGIDAGNTLTGTVGQFYNSNMQLDGDVSMFSVSGPIRINRNVAGAVGDENLAITTTTANIILGDGVNDDFVGQSASTFFGTLPAPIGTLTTSSTTGFTVFNMINSSTDTPSVLTAGAQTYNNRVQLLQNTALVSSGFDPLDDITFGNTVNTSPSATQERSLQVVTDGDKAFLAQVGGLSPLQALTTGGFSSASAGTTTFGPLNAAPQVTTVNQQQYNDLLRIQSNLRLNAGTNLEIFGGLTSIGGPFDATLNGFNVFVGNGTSASNISNIANLFVNPLVNPATNERSFIINSPHPAGAVITTRTQTYNAQLVLSANTRLVSTGGGDIFFRNRVNSNASPPGARNFIVDTAGQILIGDGVGVLKDNWGANAALGNVTLNGGTILFRIPATSISDPAMVATGNQIFNGATRLVFDTTLVSTSAGNIFFQSTVDSLVAADAVPTATVGPKSLSVNSSGNKVFFGRLGNNQILQSFLTNAPGFAGSEGTTQLVAPGASIATPSVNTVADQRYGDAVRLDANGVVRSQTGNIQFQSRIDSQFAATPRDLTVNTQSGKNVDFGDGVGRDFIGSENKLNCLIVGGGNITRFNIANSTAVNPSVSTLDCQVYNGDVVMRNNTVLQSNTANIQTNGRISGAFGLNFVGIADSPLSGIWTFNGQQVRVIQAGTTLKFVNEFGGQSNGVQLNATTVEASHWGPLTGAIDGNNIRWSNGSVWIKSDPSGTYTFNGGVTRVSQSGAIVTFTNEAGGSTQGAFSSLNTLSAPGWGNLTAVIDNNRISWSNGSVWTKIDLAPNWTVNGQRATVRQQGADFVFTAPSGATSIVKFTTPTILFADQFAVSAQLNQGRIVFANGNVWNKNLSLVGTSNGQGVRLDMTSQSLRLTTPTGAAFNARLVSPSRITAGPLGGMTINNGKLVFDSGPVWDFGSPTNLGAVYSDVQNFPLF